MSRLRTRKQWLSSVGPGGKQRWEGGLGSERKVLGSEGGVALFHPSGGRSSRGVLRGVTALWHLRSASLVSQAGQRARVSGRDRVQGEGEEMRRATIPSPNNPGLQRGLGWGGDSGSRRTGGLVCLQSLLWNQRAAVLPAPRFSVSPNLSGCPSVRPPAHLSCRWRAR